MNKIIFNTIGRLVRIPILLQFAPHILLNNVPFRLVVVKVVAKKVKNYMKLLT